jgi:hypothetical protein
MLHFGLNVSHSQLNYFRLTSGSDDLAHVLRLRHLARHRTQIPVQRTAEELQQHLEANAGESWVVAAPVNFVSTRSCG